MLDLDLYQAKKLYPFQEKTVNQVLDELRKNGSNFNLLYQLPTGGGKTVIFSAIAKRYIEESGKKVLILTHRIELSIQTSKQLSAIQVPNKVINSEVKTLEDQDDYTCFIAMVETLNNRLNENDQFIENVGLVIVDEAHYNSFRKIFQFYEDANFAIRPFVWQLELDQHVTDFYVDATVDIGPINWQLELDQGVTEFYVDANFAIGPIDWQLELDQGIT